MGGCSLSALALIHDLDPHNILFVHLVGALYGAGGEAFTHAATLHCAFEDMCGAVAPPACHFCEKKARRAFFPPLARLYSLVLDTCY